jgi:O-antigen/teichoic acid export membrane protein
VGLLTNNTLTGYYSIAEKIAGVIQTFPLTSFSQAMYPRLSKIFTRNKKRALKIMYKAQNSASAGFVVSLPVIFLAAPWIVQVVCGARYQEVVMSLRLLLPAVFFVGANAFKVQFLLVCGRSDIYSRIHVSMALAGLPLIFLLIYRFSYLGAAFSTIITEAGILILTFIMLKRWKKEPA